jgi:hypothetical protein
MDIKRFKPTQKFRVISGNISIYTTAREIRRGVGDFMTFNAAVQKALDSLEYTRSCGGVLSSTVGQAGTWEGMPVQIDVAVY